MPQTCTPARNPSPVYRLLSEPLTHGFEGAPRVVVHEDYARPGKRRARASAVVCAQRSPRLARWASKLLDEVALDCARMMEQPDEQADERYSSMSGVDLKALALEEAGLEFRVHPMGPDQGLPDHHIDALWPFVLFAFVPGCTSAVGYCTVHLRFSAQARRKTLTLAVEPHEAWVHPAYRGRGLGSMLARAAAHCATSVTEHLARLPSLAQLDSVPLAVEVIGEVYSLSGETFVQCCAAELQAALELSTTARLRLRTFQLHVCW